MKKGLFTMMILASVGMPVFAQLGPAVTSWILNLDSSVKGYNNIPSNILKLQYSASNVYVSCACIPGYSIGPWNMNPNTPINNNFVYKLTRTPQKATGTPTAIGLGHIGVWSNGVSIFNADDAQKVNTVWARNAYYFERNSFDTCLGHPAPGGEYHHHVSPRCLYDPADSTHHSPIIGYMFDGYPIYGAYGYADTMGGGVIKRMRSGYRLRADQSRTKQPDGTTASNAGPAVSTQYAFGCFIWDYEWAAGVGDLDASNGRWCKTPEYPNGTYAYFVTIDETLAPVFPYTAIGTYYGAVQSGNIGAGPGNPGGHNTISEATTNYTGAGPSGINDKAEEIKLELMPNPTNSGYVYIYMDNNSPNNVKGELYNESGQLLHTIDYMQPSIAYALDLTSYPAGIYMLHMSDGKLSTVKRIVKEN